MKCILIVAIIYCIHKVIVSLFIFQPQQVVQEKPAQVCQKKSCTMYN